MSQPLNTLSLVSERAVLFDRYGMVIFAYIRKHTATREDAEDLALEVFLAALEADDIRLFVTSDGGASWRELKAIPTISKLTPATMGYLTSAGWAYFTAHEGFGPGNFTTQIQTGQANAAPATLPHLVARKWLVRFMCIQDHTVKMELNGKGFTVTSCAQQPASTVVTLSSAQAFSSLNVHASNGGRWLAVLLACTNEKLCK